MDLRELYQIYLSHPVVTTDSRRCPEGSMFFALRGDTFDGNAYAHKALEAGCAVAVVDDARVATDPRIILVDDVLQTLQRLAAHHRRCLSIPVVQITGTNGKTTTKELLSAVLSRHLCTLATQGNLNNHIGVPLTLLRLTSEHEMAVVETGANHPGEIADLSRMVEADAGLVTNVGRAHLEGFGSFEGVKATKGELYDDLRRRHALLFLNTDDADLSQMARERGFRVGQDAEAYVEGRVEACDPFVRFAWREPGQGVWHSVATHLVGAYNVANLRAAVTVGLHFGVQPSEIDAALADYQPTNSRSEFRSTGRNHLIVDAYNANPTSMAAAIDNFRLVPAEHKMAILGDMRELGAESPAEHQRVLRQLAEAGIEHLWLVGDEFRRALQAVGEASFACRPRCFATVEEAKAALLAEPIDGHTILVKGSNGTRLYLLPEVL